MRITIIFLLLLAFTGCDWLSDEFESLTLNDLNRLKCEWQDPEKSRWFYIGSEDGAHKFIHRDLPGDKLYQIKTSEFAIDKPKHVSTNEANWVKMPWGPTDEACKQ